LALCARSLTESNLTLPHGVLGFGHRVVRAARADVARHDVGHAQRTRRRALEITGDADVAVGDNPGDAALVIEDGHGAAVLFPHDADRRVGRIVDATRARRAAHHFVDVHGLSLRARTGAAMRERLQQPFLGGRED
jgi:hypothetical protein